MSLIHVSDGPIRTGLIGFGTSGRLFHSPFIDANPEFSLDLIVTKDPARRAAAAQRYPRTRLVDGTASLFAEAANLDLVVIGSPSGTHVELAHTALDAGLAVVVDKPFAVTSREGGGVLFDLGAHLIDQALVLFGPVDDIYAETVTRRRGGTADDDTFVALHHGSGVRSHLWMNGLAAQVGPRFHVLGSESGYTKWGLDGQEEALKAGGRPTDPGFGVDDESTWGVLGIDGALTPVPAEHGSYVSFYTGLADALLRGAPMPVDPEDSLRVISIIERINLLTH
jgi:predicted dehydrogenase